MRRPGLTAGRQRAGRHVLPLALAALVLLAGAVVVSRLPSPGQTGTGASATASPALPALPRTPASQRALALLARAVGAEGTLAYAGRRYVALSSATGERSALVDLLHQPGRGYRVTVAPTVSTTGGTVLEADDSSAVLGPLDAQALRLLEDHYTAGQLVGTPVAGRATEVVELRDPAGRPAARYWLDTRTMLPLQRVVLDEQGRVEQASAYTSVTLGEGAAAAYQALGGDRPAGTGHDDADDPATNALSAADLVAMRQDGWTLPDVLGPRSLQLVSALMVHASPPALHLRYTDGLCSVSVFEEQGHLDPADLHGWRTASLAGTQVRMAGGPPEQVVWSSGGRVYTVVSEDPDGVDDAVAALPHASAPRDAASRLLRGVQRLGRWVDPTR